MFNPTQTAGFDGDDIKAARRRCAVKIAPGQTGQKIVCCFDQAQLFAAVYTGGGAPVKTCAPASDLNEDKDTPLKADEIDFTCLAGQISAEYD